MEPLDIEKPPALLGYLRAAGHARADEEPTVRVLTGGVSNRTVLVTFEDGRAWVLKQALARLRVSVEWYSDPARIHREALGLRWLERLAPPGSITPLSFEDHDHHLLAMQAVPAPHENWKSVLLEGRIDADCVTQFARLLGTIQRASAVRAPELASVFDDRAFFESLRLEPYYAYTAAQVPEAAGFLRDLIAETRSRRLTLVHGDYSPKNVLVHAGRLILLDHEVIHWGDPAFDLGFALTHLLSKAHHIPHHRARFADAANTFWSVYRDTIGDVSWAADIEPRAVRHTLACLLARVAGRSQLEYLTPDEKSAQRNVVLALVRAPIRELPALITSFITRLS